MKKIINILILVLILISVTACNKKNQVLTDAEKFKEEYEVLNNTVRKKDNKKIRVVNIPKENPMVYITAEDLSKKLDNKESFIVYFGFSDCPWCRSVIEELISVSKDKNIGKIYYVDVGEIRDIKELDKDGNITTTKEGSKGYLELIDKLSNVLEEYKLYDTENKEKLVGEKRIYAPNVVAVSDGKAIKLVTGESKDLKDPYQKLTAKMRKETYNKFECLIDCLEKESKTCNKNSC